MRNLCVIFVLYFCTFQAYAQVRISKSVSLEVYLQDAPFSSLALLDYSERHNLLIHGENIGQFRWKFWIPDSVVDNSANMMLIVPSRDSITDSYHQIRFLRDDTNTSLVNIGIQGEKNLIEAKYKGNQLFKDENISSFLGLLDTAVNGNLVDDDFVLTLKNDGSDISIRSIDPFYSWFYNPDRLKKFSYNEYLLSYIDLAKRYPESRYLISSLSRNLNKYRSRENVREVYQYFSKSLKNSKYGERIRLYLDDKLQNLSLLNIKSKKPEKIIEGSYKYNFLIFSASWCIPCIKEIPLLKQLRDSVSKSIRFTFISMDYERDYSKFEKILAENKVTWRTLYAFNDLDRIRDFFSVGSIPYCLLIYQDEKMESMDVRHEEAKLKLMSLK